MVRSVTPTPTNAVAITRPPNLADRPEHGEQLEMMMKRLKAMPKHTKDPLVLNSRYEQNKLSRPSVVRNKSTSRRKWWSVADSNR